MATINELASRAGVSVPTAAQALDAFEQLGITHELTGRRRNRIFAYREYLAILSEGSEPFAPNS